MEVMSLPKLIFVTLYDALDFGFQSFDRLSPDLSDFFLLPLLTAHLISSLPSILVLLELHFEVVMINLALLFDLMVLVLHFGYDFFYFMSQHLFIRQEVFDHSHLLLDALSHVSLDLISLLGTCLLGLLDTTVECLTLFLSQLVDQFKSFSLLLTFEF
jgi:hypothetical protein